ncbi:uncharacterized protein LOC128990584 [Macrosteles quadrilineatus]|uniref:uncharacterized protein LOC128990584 n=1 Tax=Macrosteles quadrilineatus TaxID=74068 RepID=UPI0023E28ECC|nr:uncharacterized protein LOC128990584 [Macrosteles quadrilineatus]
MTEIKRRLLSVLLTLMISLSTSKAGSSKCYTPETIDYSLRGEFCDQPIFSVVVPKTEEFILLDNICYTYFPLPDDPSTFTLYEARVYCDGSFTVTTNVATEIGIGQSIIANPYGTVRDYIIGYAGCDTYLVYRCFVFGAEEPDYIAGFSPKCQPIGLSCLRKVKEIISERGLPEVDYYILPNKLPNRCVTQQLCIQPPNPFYNNLHSVAKL